MSHKYIVLYDTVTGSIISTEGNPPSDDVLASGSGTVTDEKMTGVDLDGNAQGDVGWVRLGGSKTMMISEWVDNTELAFTLKDRFHQGAQDYELMKEGSSVQFTSQQKADKIAAMKTQVGHDNVDALLVRVGFPITSEWKVNITTSQLEKKTADITYD